MATDTDRLGSLTACPWCAARIVGVEEYSETTDVQHVHSWNGPVGVVTMGIRTTVRYRCSSGCQISIESPGMAKGHRAHATANGKCLQGTVGGEPSSPRRIPPTPKNKPDNTPINKAQLKGAGQALDQLDDELIKGK